MNWAETDPYGFLNIKSLHIAQKAKDINELTASCHN